METNIIKNKLEDLEKSEFILHHHLGLGDHIVMNGMVNYLSKQYKKIHLPAKENNYPTIKFMFEKNDKVEVFKIGLQNEYQDIKSYSDLKNLEILKVGFENIKLKKKFNLAFYEQLNLSYNISFDYFNPNYIEFKNKNLLKYLRKYYKCHDKYIILHIESSTGTYDIRDLNLKSDLPYILIEKKSDVFSNILYYLDALKEAEEVHCINSSVYTLVDRISTNGKLYFHNIKKEPIKSLTTFNKSWNYIDYY